MEEFVLYTVEEVKEILKVSRRTIYNYISSGELKALKIGKVWRIKKTDLKEFLDNAIENI